MIVVCAWCCENMGTKEPKDDDRVTHGMCPVCFEKEMSVRTDSATALSLIEGAEGKDDSGHRQEPSSERP